MFENYAYPALYGLDDFGVFHLSVQEASELIAKVLCLQGQLDIAAPEKEDEHYSLHTSELHDHLAKYIEQYRKMLVTGIDKGTLKPAHIARKPDETVLCDETYIKVDVLINWLQERSIDITGDWYEEYADAESDIAEAVLRTIAIERSKLKKGEKRNDHKTDAEKITYLENKILTLESWHLDTPPPKQAVKPLHVKERESLLKIVLGMAIKGYAYDPAASKNTTAKEISDDLMTLGLSVSDDTIRKWLKEAMQLLPPETK